MRILACALVVVCGVAAANPVAAQGRSGGRLVMDLAHGQQPLPPPYGPVLQTLGLEVKNNNDPITSGTLEGTRLLYLRAPSQPFADDEVAAIVSFVKGGGSLLLVLDEERRQQLARTRVNEMIAPFGLELTPDTEYLHNNGAIAKGGEINKADREIPFSGGRAVKGGTPFAYQLDAQGRQWHPFGAFTRVDGGGRIVVLGEGMASLFLGDPKGVRLSGDRQNLTPYWGKDSGIFMEEVLAWLTK